MGADAKIDLEKVCSILCPSLTISASSFILSQNVIEINRPPLPVYQNVIEKTRQLAVRTQALGVTVSRTGQGANASSPKNDNKDQVVAQAVTA